jgi:putative transposase
VAFKRSRNLPDYKSYRVTRDRAGRWHIAFAAIPDPIPAPGTGEVVGVDRGVKAAVALSTGDLSSPAGLGAKEAERLLRLQRRLARAQRGSNRRGMLKVQIARLRAREADRRKDWVEARGTLEAPGRGVRAKAGLNRGILKAGWSMLVTRPEQKAPGRVEKINPAYTSQICHACGHIASASRENQAVFRCVACGHCDHADINAAKNIADRRSVTARGDQVMSARSVKRETQHARPPKVACQLESRPFTAGRTSTWVHLRPSG